MTGEDATNVPFTLPDYDLNPRPTVEQEKGDTHARSEEEKKPDNLLTSAIKCIVSQPKDKRYDQLHKSAFALGKRVASGDLVETEREIVRRLSEAMKASDVPMDIIEETIEDYLEAGKDSVFEHTVEAHHEKEEDKPAKELDDAEIIRTAESNTDDKFKQLMAGNWAGYSSSSEARMALYGYLVYYCHNYNQIARIFKKSGLYKENPEQCDQLMEDEISKAKSECKGHYQPKSKAVKKVIQVNETSLDEVAEKVVDAIEAHNDPPNIFVRGGKLVKVVRNDFNIPAIKMLDKDAIALLMSRSATFVKSYRGKHGSHQETVYPPGQVIGAVCSYEKWPFPKLDSVTATPIVRVDGSICTEPGFDSESRIYYDGDLKLDIPDNPTKKDAEDAAKFIMDEVICDFPFEDEASKAAAFAGILELVIRPMIPGQIPMMLINKPQPGVGASLLADVISLIGLGMPASMSSWTNNEEETRKNITTMIRDGQLMICFDNVTGQLKSAVLNKALTSPIHQDRILGKTEAINLPQRACWYATGNNVVVAGDMFRRIFPCNMASPCERPFERSGFSHQNLRVWVLEHRKMILEALLTMTKAWITAERPKGNYGKLIGSFEAWTEIIDGILSYAGVEGFLTNTTNFYESEDTDTQEWKPFLIKLREIFGDLPFTVADISKCIPGRLKPDDLPGELSQRVRLVKYGSNPETADFSKSFKAELGKGLKSVVGKRFGVIPYEDFPADLIPEKSCTKYAWKSK